MIETPFRILDQFSDRLRVGIVNKADAQSWDGKRFIDSEAGKLFGAKHTAGLQQIHGSDCLKVSGQLDRDRPADSMITDQPGLLLSIRWADCQNFVVYEPTRHVAGVIHAGWRGLARGVLPSFWEALQEEWGISPEETFVGAGPSLCQQCAEFTDPRTELPNLDSKFVNKRCVDLIGFAEQQLNQIGIPNLQRERVAACTRCDPSTWWTYRGGDQEDIKVGCTNALCCMLK